MTEIRDRTSSSQRLVSEEHLSAILSITARIDGFLYRCRNDPSYTMLYLSDGIVTVSGYPSSEFLGNQVRAFSSIIEPEDLNEVYAAVDMAIKARGNWDIDYRILPREGPPVWVHEVGAGVFSETGELEFLEGFIVNVTERKQMETALREIDLRLMESTMELQRSLTEKQTALDMAEAANRAKTSFLAVMSHELRTPLNAVIGLSDLIAREIHGRIGNEKYVEYIADINFSGKALLSMIDDILDLTRMEVGNYNLKIEPTDVAEVWERSCNALQVAAVSRGIRLHGPKKTDGITLLADSRAVSQIVTKLVENAIKFTANGGEVQVDFKEEAVTLDVVLTVRDNGRGMSPEVLQSVMQPFTQGSEGYSRDTGGIGLGLTICKLLSGAMAGRIEIESELDKGTIVRVFLPGYQFSEERPGAGPIE